MLHFRKIKSFFKNKYSTMHYSYLGYFIVFSIAFLVFSYLQASPIFADPDSFYHIKISQLIIEKGPMKEFPWLQFTVLRDNFIDHHFLYHIFLLPFVVLFDPLVGAKLATVIFASLFVLVFYFFLQQSRISGAFWYSVFLLVINPFIFRASLTKAPALSLIFLVLILLCIFRRYLFALFFLSFFYVWLHASWPLVGILVGVYVVVGSVFDAIKQRSAKTKKREIKKLFSSCIRKFLVFWKKLFSRTNIKLAGSALCGLMAGLVLNPFFPQNLKFYYYQIYEIAVRNYQGIIRVGGEWYSYNFFNLINNGSLVFILLLFGVIFFIFGFKKQNEKSWALFLLTLFFYIITLRSRRNIEYFVPFAILFSAFSIYLGFQSTFVQGLLKEMQRLINPQKWYGFFIICFFLFAIPYIGIRDIRLAKTELKNGFAFDRFKQVSLWLKDNTPEHSIVFHNDWDDFPHLFYYNSHNYYIVGLDPRFMYMYDQDLYKKWDEITTGKLFSNLYDIIKNQFRASYILIDTEHSAFEENVKMTPGFSKVYEDNQASVYLVE